MDQLAANNSCECGDDAVDAAVALTFVATTVGAVAVCLCKAHACHQLFSCCLILTSLCITLWLDSNMTIHEPSNVIIFTDPLELSVTVFQENFMFLEEVYLLRCSATLV